MSENPLLRNLVPHLARSGEYTPKEGDLLTLSLPGEIVQTKVMRTSSKDGCIVQITSVPMARGHQYKKDDIVPARRTNDKFLGVEKWEVVSERELQLYEVTSKFEREELARVAREDLERKSREQEAIRKAEEF